MNNQGKNNDDENEQISIGDVPAHKKENKPLQLFGLKIFIFSSYQSFFMRPISLKQLQYS